jgi:hypothetical protein
MGDPEPQLSILEERPMRCSHRDPGDDFFCLRFQVWYPSVDCALRTRFRTSPGCLACDQGRFNLRRHAAELARTRFRPVVLD